MCDVCSRSAKARYATKGCRGVFMCDSHKNGDVKRVGYIFWTGLTRHGARAKRYHGRI